MIYRSSENQSAATGANVGNVKTADLQSKGGVLNFMSADLRAVMSSGMQSITQLYISEDNQADTNFESQMNRAELIEKSTSKHIGTHLRCNSGAPNSRNKSSRLVSGGHVRRPFTGQQRLSMPANI